MHKRTNKQISNLHICPSDEFQNRIKLMVEINRMRYFALFYPTQKMEHIKTLVYVLTGVMPRLQEVYYRQLMESRLPFEDLISGSVDDVIQTKNTLQRHMVSINAYAAATLLLKSDLWTTYYHTGSNTSRCLSSSWYHH